MRNSMNMDDGIQESWFNFDNIEPVSGEERYLAIVTPAEALTQGLIGFPGPYNGLGYLVWSGIKLREISEAENSRITRDAIDCLRDQCTHKRKLIGHALDDVNLVVKDLAFTLSCDGEQLSSSDVDHFADGEDEPVPVRDKIRSRARNSAIKEYRALSSKIRKDLDSYITCISYVERLQRRVFPRNSRITTLVAYSEDFKESVFPGLISGVTRGIWKG